MQELLRHANSRITLDIYTQAMSPEKHGAQARVLEMFLPESGRVGERQKSLLGPKGPQ